MRRQRNIFQRQEQDKVPEEETNGVDISNVTDKEIGRAHV